jgi:hypothetical protein
MRVLTPDFALILNCAALACAENKQSNMQTEVLFIVFLVKGPPKRALFYAEGPGGGGAEPLTMISTLGILQAANRDCP